MYSLGMFYSFLYSMNFIAVSFVEDQINHTTLFAHVTKTSQNDHIDQWSMYEISPTWTSFQCMRQDTASSLVHSQPWPAGYGQGVMCKVSIKYNLHALLMGPHAWDQMHPVWVGHTWANQQTGPAESVLIKTHIMPTCTAVLASKCNT